MSIARPVWLSSQMQKTLINGHLECDQVFQQISAGSPRIHVFVDLGYLAVCVNVERPPLGKAHGCQHTVGLTDPLAAVRQDREVRVVLSGEGLVGFQIIRTRHKELNVKTTDLFFAVSHGLAFNRATPGESLGKKGQNDMFAAKLGQLVGLLVGRL